MGRLAKPVFLLCKQRTLPCWLINFIAPYSQGLSPELDRKEAASSPPSNSPGSHVLTGEFRAPDEGRNLQPRPKGAVMGHALSRSTTA